MGDIGLLRSEEGEKQELSFHCFVHMPSRLLLLSQFQESIMEGQLKLILPLNTSNVQSVIPCTQRNKYRPAVLFPFLRWKLG